MKKLGQAGTLGRSMWSVGLAVAVLCPVAAAAQEPVPVVVTVQTSQFEDQAQKDRLDTAKDLKQHLNSKKKTLRLVESPAEAVVIIEVLGRGEQASGDAKLQRGALGGVEQTRYKDKVVRVKLSVGEYSTEIEGRNADGEHVIRTTWGLAAVDAASKIDNWIKTNRAKLPAR